eukprot:715080_1
MASCTMASYHLLSILIIMIILIQLIDASQYILVEQRVYWNEASLHCQNAYGTFLASIHSLLDNIEAANLCKSSCQSCGKVAYGCFIGLNDQLNERDDARDGWVWQDGSSYDFENWRNGVTQFEPMQDEEGGPAPDEDCVVIFPSDHPDTGYQTAWADVQCEQSHDANQPSNPGYFLCNNPLTTDPTASPSKMPTVNPSSEPSVNPTRQPSMNPSGIPTIDPGAMSSQEPITMNTSQQPNQLHVPTMNPAHHPSRTLTITPSEVDVATEENEDV